MWTNGRRIALIRNITVFTGALLLYIICLDRGASLWDCPEYILTAWRLEIGHPPGNPTWQLAANVMAHLGGSARHAAVIINAMSAIAMALASVFTGAIGCRLLRASLWKEDSEAHKIWANVCGACGALCYAWCDSAIFSAVEAEVYALSAMFTSLMLLLALKWAEKRREGNISASRRLIILMAYIAGLGVGSHELNFLVLPAVALVYWYGCRRYPLPSSRTGLRRVLPSTGALPTALWSLLLFCIGTTTYLIIPIRAAANPPINTADPSTFEKLLSYYGREQYGAKPLLYGRTPYSRPLLRETFDSVTGEPLYNLYYLTEKDGRKDYVYPPELDMWFPRMTSNRDADIKFYEAWTGMSPDRMVEVEASTAVDTAGNRVGKLNSLTGEREKELSKRPTYMQQLRYFAGYQLGYMYFRYLLWNYGGRQNNIASTGEANHGNFITGIGIIDDAMLGPQAELPYKLREGNAGHNVYYLIPFILGIIGIVALMRDGRDGRRVCAVIATFFLFTGMLIVVYLNQDPGEPRERDYSFLGSYMAYALWISAGMAAVVRLILKLKVREKLRRLSAAASLLFCLAIPTQILSQTYDDHNRSRSPGAEEIARRHLEPLEPNAIILASGDNFIFPFWYGQEVLGIRRDVTVVAIPYLNADWYWLQLKRPGEESIPLTIDDTVPSGYGTRQDRAIRHIRERNPGRPIYERDSTGQFVKQNESNISL